MGTNGIIVIDKPQGWTSMDICAKLRGMYREKRIGHAGTLDPMATGVLPVFIGSATRAVEFADKGDKEYVAGLKLGIVTNTQDTSGEVLESSPVSVTPEQLEEALAQFPQIKEDPAPAIFLSEYGASSIGYTVRVWVDGTDYWTVYFGVMEAVRETFQRNGVEMTYDHLNVHVLNK